jgi:hypothetical protein
VNLSQAATENNAVYNSQQANDDGHSIAMEEEEGEDTLNVMDESMDTYATKSPEQQYATLSQETNSPIRRTKKHSAMSTLKPKIESLCNAIGTDQELMSELLIKTLAKHRGMSDTARGMQSYPAMDKSRKSVRIESCRMGSSAVRKSKKRAARKPPPSASI